MRLDLDEHAWQARSRGIERQAPRLGDGDPDRHFLARAVVIAQRHTMLAGGGRGERVEQEVELGERPAAHHGDGVTKVMMELRQQIRQARRHHDLFRCRRDLEQGAVEVEEQRGFPVEFRWCHPAPSAFGTNQARRVLNGIRRPRRSPSAHARFKTSVGFLVPAERNQFGIAANAGSPFTPNLRLI